MANKWYADQTILFTCTKCSRCCKRKGMVHFTQEDIRNASQYLEMTEDDFTTKYLFDHNGIKFVPVSSKKYCPFLTDQGCKIHDAKPSQCAMYPFWPHIIDTRIKWQQERLHCKGIGKGATINVSAIVGGKVDMEKVDKETQNMLFCLVSCGNNYHVNRDGTCRSNTCIFYESRKEEIMKNGCKIFILVKKLEEDK